MRQVLPTLPVLLLAFIPACAGDPLDRPDCGDNCDSDLPVQRGLVECWLEADEEEDDFFRLDKLHCSYHPESASLDIQSVSMDVILADGNREGVLFQEDNAGTDNMVTGIQSDQFPLELSVSINLGFSDRNDNLIGLNGLRQTRQTITLAGLADATLEAPLQISLPFDVMTLDFLNRHAGEARIDFDHSISIGSETIDVDKTRQIAEFGLRAQFTVAVSKGAETLGATTILHDTGFPSTEIGRHESVYRGSGTYEISLDKTRLVENAELVEAQGHAMALCRMLTNSIPASESCTEDCQPTVTHDFHCFGNSAPGVEDLRHLRLIPTVAEGEIAQPIDVDFSGNGEVSVPLEVHQLPVQVEIHSVLDDSVSGLARLAIRTHVAKKLVSTEDEVFNAHLPFILSTIELEASPDVLFARLQPDERFLEIGYTFEKQFALNIRDDQALSVQSTSGPASLVIAVPVEETSISAILDIVDQQGGTTTIPVVISHGHWRVDIGGITALD